MSAPTILISVAILLGATAVGLVGALWAAWGETEYPHDVYTISYWIGILVTGCDAILVYA